MSVVGSLVVFWWGSGGVCKWVTVGFWWGCRWGSGVSECECECESECECE